MSKPSPSSTPSHRYVDAARLKVGEPCYQCGKIIQYPLSHLCEVAPAQRATSHADAETWARYWTYWYERHTKEAAEAKKFAEEYGAVFTPSETLCIPEAWSEMTNRERAAYNKGVESAMLKTAFPSATPCSAPTKAELMECYRFWCHYSSLNEGAQDDENNGRMKWLDKMEEWAL